MVVRMLPIFLTTIFFWTIYSQARPPLLLLSSSLSSLPHALPLAPGSPARATACLGEHLSRLIIGDPYKEMLQMQQCSC